MRAEVKDLIYRFVANIPNQNTKEGKDLSDKLLADAMALTVTPEEKKEAGSYLLEAMKRRRRPDVDVKAMLSEISDALSLSYIAKQYFGKDKSWIYQRMNNATVNGKPVYFTNDELKTLADSLGDLSNRLSAISSIIHRSL